MKIKVLFLILIFIVLCQYDFVYAARGCCSWHGGIAGCDSSGRYICADGTLSPTCGCTPSYIYGCTDSNAKNYNSSANKDDGSCTYYKYGCTDSSAKNYDSRAERDDGNCIYYKYGCMDTSAENYNLEAEIDDGSCTYSVGKIEQIIDNSELNVEVDDINLDENDAIIMFFIYVYLVLSIILLVLSNYLCNLNTIFACRIHNINSYFVKLILYPLYVICIFPLIIDFFAIIDGIIHK